MRFLLLFSISLFTQFIFAQNPSPPFSAPGSIMQQVGTTQIRIDYERPSARGRAIYGGLVPFGKVWRTGAGPCTQIRFSKAVKVGGQSVAAGQYSLLSIPDEAEWTFMLNSDTTLYGHYRYDYQKNVAVFKAKPQSSKRFYETLNFDIDIVPNHAMIYISWANTTVAFLVETDTDEVWMQYINDELLSGKVKDADALNLAAELLSFHNRDYYKALQLVEKALAIEPSGYGFATRMRIYEKMGYYKEAIEAGEKGKALRSKINPDDPDMQEEIRGWEKDINALRQKLKRGSGE